MAWRTSLGAVWSTQASTDPSCPFRSIFRRISHVLGPQRHFPRLSLPGDAPVRRLMTKTPGPVCCRTCFQSIRLGRPARIMAGHVGGGEFRGPTVALNVSGMTLAGRTVAAGARCLDDHGLLRRKLHAASLRG